MNIFLDLETFHDSKDGFDLRKMSLVEYVRDPRFKIHGMGVAFDEEDPFWVPGKDIDQLFDERVPAGSTFVAHNSKFDFSCLPRQLHGAALFLDTKAMARAILGKSVEDYSLRTLAEYFGLPAKGELKTDGIRDLNEEQEKNLAAYCLRDVGLCRDIFRRVSPVFPSSQLPHLDWTIRSFVYPVLRVNTEILDEAVLEEKRRKAEAFEKIGIPKSTFSSNTKFAGLLLGSGVSVPTKRSGRTGKEIPALACGDTAFLDLLEDPDERIRSLCEARKEAKSTLLETRCAKLASVGRSGPWPFDVEFSGAAQTHRYSGGGGAAGNCQNFTRDSALREAVEAPPGHVLVVGDFAAIEMRLVAYLANDRGLINAIEGGKDVYCEFASSYFGRAITKADKAERWFGKTAILGLGYGMGPKKFAHTVRVQTGQRISDREAARAVRLYRTKYHRVPQLWAHLGRTLARMGAGESGAVGGLPVVLEDGNIVLPSGLKLQYPGLRTAGKRRDGTDEWVYDAWRGKNTKEEARIYGGKLLENITQSLAGELAKEANRAFVSDQSLAGAVHDETILCVPDGGSQAYAAALKAAMSTPPVWLPRLKLGAEIGIGKSWRQAKAG